MTGALIRLENSAQRSKCTLRIQLKLLKAMIWQVLGYLSHIVHRWPCLSKRIRKKETNLCVFFFIVVTHQQPFTCGTMLSKNCRGCLFIHLITLYALPILPSTSQPLGDELPGDEILAEDYIHHSGNLIRS